MPSALQFENVSFAYDDHNVLKNINCAVNEGQFVGIIGPNGGGKTTFLKLAMGFLEPTRGKVLLFGKSPGGSHENVAYVPQNLRYDKMFPLSVVELVLMGRLKNLPWWGSYSREDEERALQALEMVGIADLKKRAVGSLSGGQFQRALIARALASRPKMIILDEPTANVDSQAETAIYRLLEKLSKEMTVLMVTHDLGVAVNLVDTIFCLQGDLRKMQPSQVCEHFALGLYHPPLLREGA